MLSVQAGLTPKSGGVHDSRRIREINDAGPDRGVVFQSPSLLPWLSAIQNVLIGAEQVYPHATEKAAAGHCGTFLGLVGLGEFAA